MDKKKITFERACAIVRAARTKGQKVVFTSGCFDILHVGHVVFLEACKRKGDILIVGIDDNETVQQAKGEDHPFFDETERMKVLAALEIVDYVFKFRGPCSVNLLVKLKPHFYCFSPYDPKRKYKIQDARKAGAEPKEVGYSLKSWSSSKVGRAIRFAYLINSWFKPY